MIDGDRKVQVMSITGGSTVNLLNLTIANGFSARNGGGLENRVGLVVYRCTFSGNNSRSEGCAIYNEGALTVDASTFTENGAAINGHLWTAGGIFNKGGTTVTNSTFSANSTDCGAGGIFSDEGSGLTIINSTFANSSADPKCTTFGSGAVAGFTAWKVSFRTFSGNTGPTTGAISSSGQITAKGTIVAGATSVPNCNKKAITDAGYNISDDTSCGFAKTGSAKNGDGVDPKLSAKGLSDNGGFTQTIALEPASPAVDAIPVDNCTDPNGNRLFTDQRGFPRPAPHHTMCDIGAFELQDSELGARDTCRDDCEYRHQSCVDDADYLASDCYGTCNGLTRCREECFHEHRNAVKACDSQLDDCKNQCPPTPPM